MEAVEREAELREMCEVLDMKSFETLRRENSAIRLCFGLFEFALGIDLPDDLFEDKAFMDLYWAAADMVCWANVRRSLHISRIYLIDYFRMCILTRWSMRKVTLATTSSLFYKKR